MVKSQRSYLTITISRRRGLRKDESLYRVPKRCGDKSPYRWCKKSPANSRLCPYRTRPAASGSAQPIGRRHSVCRSIRPRPTRRRRPDLLSAQSRYSYRRLTGPRPYRRDCRRHGDRSTGGSYRLAQSPDGSKAYPSKTTAVVVDALIRSLASRPGSMSILGRQGSTELPLLPCDR